MRHLLIEVVWKLQKLNAIGVGGSKIKSASNIGAAGVGIFKKKVRANLEFKKLNAASGKVTITDDRANDEVDVEVNEANLRLGKIGGTLSNAKLDDIGSSTIKGRISAGTSDPEDLTAANVREIINVEDGADVTDEINVRDALGTATADISVNHKKITDVDSPTLDTDVVNKAYADAIRNGLDWKQSVRVATTANITLRGTQPIDGVSVVSGDRVLVKNQSMGSENGIYEVAAGAWVRSSDADIDSEVTSDLAFFVEEGTTNADNRWVLTTNAPITVDTTALTFTQFSGLGQITAGAGLTKDGNTISVLDASETQKGAVKRATDDDAAIGEDTEGYINSKQLKENAGGGYSGGTRVSTAVDITLTNASDQAQAVTMTAADKKVNLPDATTMKEGAFAFVIVNEGAQFPFAIVDHAGASVSCLNGGEQANITLVDNSSAAGVWIATITRKDTPYLVESVSFATSNNFNAIAALDSTHALLVYADATANDALKASVITFDGVIVSVGVAATIDTNDCGERMTITALSASKAICFYEDVTDTDLMVCVLDISGTTVTPGTPKALNPLGYKRDIDCDALDSTHAILAYKNSVNKLRIVAVAISGTTITEGAAVTSVADVRSRVNVVALSATRAIAAWTSPLREIYVIYGQAFDISGTTITRRGTRVIFGVTKDYLTVSKLDTDTFSVYYILESNNYRRYITAVESVIGGIEKLNEIYSPLGAIDVPFYLETAPLAAHKAVAVDVSGSNSGQVITCYVCYFHNDGVVSFGPETPVSNKKGRAPHHWSMCVLNENNVLIADASDASISVIHIP